MHPSIMFTIPLTATSNISGKLLGYILKNHKEESNIQNFQLLQKLQEDIRETLFLLEPISALKAFLSVKNNEKSWNRINPPLTTISDPFNNKTINSLITLIKKMDELLPSA